VEETMTNEKLNIGIILGSTRQGRVSPQVGEWVKGIADNRGDANYELVDIADYHLPFLGTTDGTEQELQLGTKNLTAWMDSYLSFRNIITV
jgi:NAD(P)H-dependent FMN reductase